MSPSVMLDCRQTASRLLDKRTSIIETWERAVRAREANVGWQARAPLRDILPALLTGLADAVVDDGSENDLRALAREHGEQWTRLPDYGLDQLFEEYRLLRVAVFEALEDGGEAPDPIARTRLTDAIEATLQGACLSFTAIHMEQARLATEHRDQLLAIVSHDLRSPLQTILMAAGVLRRAPDQAGRDTSLRQIERAVRLATKLTDDLLDIAQIEAGGLRVDAEVIEIGSLLQDAVDLASSHEPEQELVFDIPPSTGRVLADRTQILRVFDNLLRNAVKFTDPGGRVTVTAASTDAEVRFCVADTGCGIPPEDLPHVFERFRRVDRRFRSGAGLGLAIAKGIVEAHGGRISIESEPGSWTCVCFTLPRHREA